MCYNEYVMKTKLTQGEYIIYKARKHGIVLFFPFIIMTAFIVLSLIFMTIMKELWFLFFLMILMSILIFLYLIVERKNNIWIVTNLRLIDEYGVFSRNSKETPLDKIHNVSYGQSLIGRLFDYGNVEIQSAAQEGATIYYMVKSPRELRDVIVEEQEKYKQQMMRREAEILAHAVDED